MLTGESQVKDNRVPSMVSAILFPLADKTQRQLPWHAQNASAQSGKEPCMSSGTASPHALSSDPHAPAYDKTTASDGNPEFAGRHISLSATDEQFMLEAIGATSRDALIEEIVPASIMRRTVMDLPSAVSEQKHLQNSKRWLGITASAKVSWVRVTSTNSCRYPAKCFGEPCLVHRLHTLPGRNFSGPNGSCACISDNVVTSLACLLQMLLL